MRDLPKSGSIWHVSPAISDKPLAGVVARRLPVASPDELVRLSPGETVTVLGLHLRGRGEDWNTYARCESPSREGEVLVPLFQFGPGGWMGEGGGEGG